jgi:Domain of unknown function (DUF4411)
VRDVVRECFCLDTSFLINSWNKYYRYDVFPAVWDFLDQLMSDNSVFSCREVYEELIKQKDPLATWAKRRKSYFHDPDEATLDEFGKIMADHPNFAAAGGSPGRADPWVIAQATVTGSIIVTDELPARKQPKPTKPPKIPDICTKRDLKWLTPIDFLAKNDFRATSSSTEGA